MQQSVWSAVVKYFVPTVIEGMVQRLSVILGARYYLRDEHDLGVFQRVLRDSAIISVFDGSTVVNLHALILQLRRMARLRTKPDEVETRLEQIFQLGTALSGFDGSRLSLASRQADTVWRSLGVAEQRMKGLDGDPSVSAELVRRLTAIANTLAGEMEKHDELMRDAVFEHGHRQSPAAFETARRYCAMHAAATCLQMWVWNRQNLGSFFSNGTWLVLALERLLRDHLGLLRDSPHASSSSMDEVSEELLRLHREDRQFSMTGLQLAGPRAG